MRLATVVASSYGESPALTSLDSAPEAARAVYHRLSEPDAAFAVEWFEAHRDFPEELAGLLGCLPQRPDSALVYFSGYLVWQPDRPPALALHGTRPRAFPLSRLCGTLDRFCSEYLVILDVGLTADGQSTSEVADAVCEVLGEHAPRAGGLVAIAPAASPNSVSMFTRLLMAGLEALREQTPAVTARSLYEHMRSEIRRLSPAVRYWPAERDFVMLPGWSEQARSMSSPEYHALARQAALLHSRQAWAELAEVYQAMLEFAEPGTTHELARRLATLRRSEFGDAWGAINTLEQVVLTDGGSAPVRFDLSELYLANEQLDLALEHCLAGLLLDPREAMGYRRARWLFERSGQTDQAWNAAAALTCLGAADPEEAEFAERHRPQGLLAATATLTEEHWQRGLGRPRSHAALEQVLKLVSASAIEYRLQALVKHKHLPGLDPSTRQDPKTSTTTLCRSLTWTARLLGMSAPELYVYPSEQAEMLATPAPQPTTRVSKTFASGLTLPELVFLWGRHLAYFRPDHYLRVFFPSVDDMTRVLLASMLASDWDPQRMRQHDPETTRLAAHLRRAVDPQQLAVLRGATRKLTVANGRARVRDWVEAVGVVANRAGLLACGDVAVAAEMIRRFPVEASDLDLVGDLLQYSLSPAYAELRQRIGVAL